MSSLVVEGGLVRTWANCGIDESWIRRAAEFAGRCRYVLIMMLADVGITVVMNDAGFFGPAKVVYAACSQRRV